MANILYLCGREGATRSYTDADLERVARRITPDNAPDTIEIRRSNGMVSCIVGESSTVDIRGTSVCLGHMLPTTDVWDTPGTVPPDGSYALVRDDNRTVELVSDAVGSRTLYYRLFDDLFVCSTSQRAVMHFAESFEPDERAIAWMVSSGTLGPRQTWDSNVEHVPPDASVQLDRTEWDLNVQENIASFSPVEGNLSTSSDRLDDAIEVSCAAFDADISRWALPLSGGIDSRELLTRFGDREGLEAITWGTADALEDPNSDASVARDIAAAHDVPHRYHELPPAPMDVETIFERFLTAGEGRIDHLAGYTDGFETFSSLADDGVHGIIRGDVPQSSTVVKSSTHVRFAVGARMVDDYGDLSSLSFPGRTAQTWPDRYERRDGESLTTWRDRIYQTYRIPVVLAALTALKDSYVEVVNPLLTRETVAVTRQLPDNMRMKKEAFTAVALDGAADVRVAENSATPSYSSIFGHPDTVEYLRASIETDEARDLLGSELVDWTLASMGTNVAESGSAPTGTKWSSLADALKYSLARHVPGPVVDFAATKVGVEPPSIAVDPNHLAFRLYIVIAMHRRLRRDVTVLQSDRVG